MSSATRSSSSFRSSAAVSGCSRCASRAAWSTDHRRDRGRASPRSDERGRRCGRRWPRVPLRSVAIRDGERSSAQGCTVPPQLPACRGCGRAGQARAREHVEGEGRAGDPPARLAVAAPRARSAGPGEAVVVDGDHPARSFFARMRALLPVLRPQARREAIARRVSLRPDRLVGVVDQRDGQPLARTSRRSSAACRRSSRFTTVGGYSRVSPSPVVHAAESTSRLRLRPFHVTRHIARCCRRRQRSQVEPWAQRRRRTSQLLRERPRPPSARRTHARPTHSILPGVHHRPPPTPFAALSSPRPRDEWPQSIPAELSSNGMKLLERTACATPCGPSHAPVKDDEIDVLAFRRALRPHRPPPSTITKHPSPRHEPGEDSATSAPTSGTTSRIRFGRRRALPASKRGHDGTQREGKGKFHEHDEREPHRAPHASYVPSLPGFRRWRSIVQPPRDRAARRCFDVQYCNDIRRRQVPRRAALDLGFPTSARTIRAISSARSSTRSSAGRCGAPRRRPTGRPTRAEPRAFATTSDVVRRRSVLMRRRSIHCEGFPMTRAPAACLLAAAAMAVGACSRGSHPATTAPRPGHRGRHPVCRDLARVATPESGTAGGHALPPSAPRAPFRGGPRSASRPRRRRDPLQRGASAEGSAAS